MPAHHRHRYHRRRHDGHRNHHHRHGRRDRHHDDDHHHLALRLLVRRHVKDIAAAIDERDFDPGRPRAARHAACETFGQPGIVRSRCMANATITAPSGRCCSCPPSHVPTRFGGGARCVIRSSNMARTHLFKSDFVIAPSAQRDPHRYSSRASDPGCETRPRNPARIPPGHRACAAPAGQPRASRNPRPQAPDRRPLWA